MTGTPQPWSTVDTQLCCYCLQSASMEINKKQDVDNHADNFAVDILSDATRVNASGHSDRLVRHYYLKSIAGAAITIDGAWVSMYVQSDVLDHTHNYPYHRGSSLAVASANGGPPGVSVSSMI
jgi:hypothetical protein